MATILIYILKWALCLALLYIPFALLLRRETFATFNRWLLIGIIAMSAILPTVTVTYPVEVEIVKFIDATGNTVANGEMQAPQGKTVVGAAEEGFNRRDLFTIETLFIVYIIGVAVTIVLRIVEIARIVTGIRRGTAHGRKFNGMTLHCHTGETAPFSWFGHVVMSQSDYEECGWEILLHEEGHFRNRHSWDMLLLSIVKSLQWFNPFAYMLANDMKEIHEYEADRHVLREHGDTRAYQLLLLRKAVGDTAFNLANNFNQSSVRRRIIMMARKPSGRMNKGKALSFAPMALLFLFIFAEPEYVYSIIEKRALPAADESVTEEAHMHAPATLESTPLPLHMQPARKPSAPKEIEPIKEVPLSAQAIRLAEKFEEHATESYCEYIDIEGSGLGNTLRGMNVRRCSVKVQFIVDKNGDAHSITPMGCNLSISGGADGYIEECKGIATRAVTEYILAKKWQATMKNGKEICTIYDAHMILNFGETRIDDNSSHTMMAGSTPIN